MQGLMLILEGERLFRDFILTAWLSSCPRLSPARPSQANGQFKSMKFPSLDLRLF